MMYFVFFFFVDFLWFFGKLLKGLGITEEMPAIWLISFGSNCGFSGSQLRIVTFWSFIFRIEVNLEEKIGLYIWFHVASLAFQ